MITKTTAESIVKISNEIDDCKEAIKVLSGRGKGPMTVLFHVFKNENDEGVTVDLDLPLALETLKRQLAICEKKQVAVNGKAVKEGAK
jgi:prefoldin subunit 5